MSGPYGKILIVDDDASVRRTLADLLRHEGYEVSTAADGFKALGKLDEVAPDLVLADLLMPGLDGMTFLRKVRERLPAAIGLIMTGHGDVRSAIEAMRQGAADYLPKPLNLGELQLVLRRELERKRLRDETASLRQRMPDERRIEGVVGASPAMQEVFETVLQVAPSRASVLLTGESGTGKELIAAALHRHSTRSARPFVKLHCAALAESLLESELFGHERGAFTGAVTRREGRFEQADGGTLFLDEIGEISAAMQVKLLRVLQEHAFERVGGNQTLHVDVRIVAATHRDLLTHARSGGFREDLYYRLNVVTVRLPALRERRSDIPLLAGHFLERFARENGKPLDGFTDAAMERLVRHRWPGNVRELENAIERAVVVCRGTRVDADDLGPMAEARDDVDGRPPVPGASLAELERYAILKTLQATGGSTTRAAAILGMSARKIQYKLQQWQAESDDHVAG